jgi:hypothetical protein
MFQSVVPAISVLKHPHGVMPGRYTIAIGLMTAYTDDAADNLARVVAERLERALAADGVTFYGLPISVAVEPSRTASEPAEQHAYQEYNPNGNSCHYPNCTMAAHDHLPAVPDGAR